MGSAFQASFIFECPILRLSQHSDAKSDSACRGVGKRQSNARAVIPVIAPNTRAVIPAMSLIRGIGSSLGHSRPHSRETPSVRENFSFRGACGALRYSVPRFSFRGGGVDLSDSVGLK